MPDQFTETTHTGLLGNLMNSVIGAFIGVLLFIAAFPVLWFNEGRVDRGSIAQKSIVIAADQANPSANGKLVAATGTLSSDEQLGDGEYLKPGPFLTLNRNAEMYAWQENQKTTETKKLGGGTDKTTTYTYEKVWTSSPASSSGFRITEGHQNPSMSIKSDRSHVTAATLGAYQVDPASLEFPSAKSVALNDELVGDADNWDIEGDFLVNRRGATSNPRVGDLRISYDAVPNDLQVTLFGKAEGDRLTGWEEKDVTLYRAFTENREAAIATMHSEYKLLLWLVRLGGFLLMWIGLVLAISPLNAVLNIIPFLGDIGGFLVGVVMFVVALVLSAITIIIGIITHNLFLLLAILVGVIGLSIFLARRRRGRQATGAA